MDRKEEILREQLKVDKAKGFGLLMWKIHKNTLKKCMQIYAKEQLRIGGVSQQRELLRSYNKFINEECLLAGGILSDFEIEKFEERNCC